LAQLALPVKPERKASPERRAHRAAPKVVSLAELAAVAKQVRKARSEQRVPKAQLVR
jgi:hypothetical protein